MHVLIPLLAALAAPAAAEDAAKDAAKDTASLAEQVAQTCGPVYTLEELSFTFIVEKGGEEKVRRSHRWRPMEGSVAVTVGGETTALADVRQGAPSSEDDPRWAEVAPGGAPTDALKAWGSFVNDSYWLLAPCKVLDGGVKRQEDGAVLTLSFDGVGLTPGDTYRLEVGEGGRVDAWSFTLQSGREGHFTWSEHTAVGPLNLSLRRTAADGETVIRFEDVAAR